MTTFNENPSPKLPPPHFFLAVSESEPVKQSSCHTPQSGEICNRRRKRLKHRDSLLILSSTGSTDSYCNYRALTSHYLQSVRLTITYLIVIDIFISYGMWWLSCRSGTLRPEGRRFESHFSRDV